MEKENEISLDDLEKDLTTELRPTRYRYKSALSNNSFRAAMLLSFMTLALVGVIGLEPQINSLDEKTRNTSAFLAGMFGSAAIEAFRKSFEDE